MEWSGYQQLTFALQSFVFGCMLGVILDTAFAFFASKNSVKMFLLDALIGVPCALLTFFVSLIIMDGQMHPILLIGVGEGALVEHVTLGRLIGKFAKGIRIAGRCVIGLTRRILLRITVAIGDACSSLRSGFVKLSKKS